MRIAINGFGRIGRSLLRVALDKEVHSNIICANDLSPATTLAHLLKYDSAYGILPNEVTGQDKSLKDHLSGEIIIDDKYSLGIISQPNPEKLPWRPLEIDVVVESTGLFTQKADAQKHINAGAKRVIISAPPKDGEIKTFVIGVNDDKIGEEKIISNSSCTTNCITPVVKIISDTLGIEKAMMTTIHAYTADQNLQDGPHKDLRRARAAAYNIVPTTTGAALSAAEVIPDIRGKFDGLAIRVPVITGSIADIVILTRKKTTVSQVNQIFQDAVENAPYKGIVECTQDPIVSSDILGNCASAIVDLSLTKVIDGNLVKIVAWYDNEWGYSCRLLDMAIKVGKDI